MNNKIPFIVFEGPDMCGKTTHIDTVVNMINKRQPFHNFKSFKFPVYNGFKGEKILSHIKLFDINKIKNVDEILNILFEHAVNLMANKFAAFNDLIKMVDGGCDGFIVDRFDISQIIYDIAWCKVLCKKTLKKSKLIDFYNKAIYRAILVHEYFSSKFDITYVFFKPSKIIKYAIESDKNRRIDKYDANIKYQNAISDIFDIFNLPSCVLEPELYKYIFNRNIQCDHRFDIFKYVAPSINSIIHTVDTDLCYKKYNKTSNFINCEDIIFNYKNKVTSDIDTAIYLSIRLLDHKLLNLS